MALASIPHDPPREAVRREYAYPRDWYATVIADAVARASDAESDREPLDVASSFDATFRPLAMPSVGGTWRLPDGSLEHRAFARLPRAEAYEDRPTQRRTVTVAFDAGGWFVRDRDGRIVRDRREVGRLLEGWPDVRRFALELLPEPAPGGRKRRQPETIARGLLFSGLRPLLGTRPAARRLMVWEEELGAPWRLAAGPLAVRFEAGDVLDARERRRLRAAESAMYSSCVRSGVEVAASAAHS